MTPEEDLAYDKDLTLGLLLRFSSRYYQRVWFGDEPCPVDGWCDEPWWDVEQAALGKDHFRARGVRPALCDALMAWDAMVWAYYEAHPERDGCCKRRKRKQAKRRNAATGQDHPHQDHAWLHIMRESLRILLDIQEHGWHEGEGPIELRCEISEYWPWPEEIGGRFKPKRGPHAR